MNAPSDTATPPRTGSRRLLLDYRYPRLLAVTRIAAGLFLICAAIALFSVGYSWWALLTLAIAVLFLVAGAWNVSIARSAAFRR